LASSRQYGNALLGVRHQEEEDILDTLPVAAAWPPGLWFGLPLAGKFVFHGHQEKIYVDGVYSIRPQFTELNW